MKLRDELNPYRDYLTSHDRFNEGFDSCESRYLPLIEKLESALSVIYDNTDTSKFYRYGVFLIDTHEYIEEALAELAEFKNKMNGEK